MGQEKGQIKGFSKCLYQQIEEENTVLEWRQIFFPFTFPVAFNAGEFLTRFFFMFFNYHTGGEVTTPRFTQYFRGSLSGLTIRPGKIETQKVISCLQACKEGLDINSMDSLGKGIKVHSHTNRETHLREHKSFNTFSCILFQFHFNPAQSVLVMESDDLENINTAMAKVSYINSRQFPTPGLRTLYVSTTIQ